MPKGIYKHYPRSKETKTKIRNTLSGRQRPLEVVEKIRAANKGQLPWNTGRKRPPFSEKHRKKLRDALLGKPSWNKDKKMLSIRGEGHWNWQGGKPRRPDKAARQSLEYRLWRESVYKRDRFTCQKYGIVGGVLRAHHILNFSTYPKLRFIIGNGITLSDKAHKEFHKKYGISNNTRVQLKEFLK